MTTKERLQIMFDKVEGEWYTSRQLIFLLNDTNITESERLVMKCMWLEGKMSVLNELIEDWE